MFDEVYYAKDARALIDGRMEGKPGYAWEPGDVVSWPHPDAGKMAIALGILVAGDDPVGWRLPSVVAGLVLLGSVYPLARRLGLSAGWAFVALMLTGADLLGIAQSRIATLDVFVAAWTALGVLFALRYVQEGRHTRWLVLSGLAGGLAVATKWSGALALVAAVVIVVLGPQLRELGPGRRTRGHEARDEGEARERSGRPAGALASLAATLGLLALCLAVLPAAVYLASYVPYFARGHSVADFRELHSQMLHFNFTLSAPHSYASTAPTWILDYRPVWYSFREIQGRFHGVVAIGNPLLWWGSILALVTAPVLALRRRSATPALTALLVVILYLPWFATTRTSFLYYMAPVAPFLAILVAAVAADLVDGPRRAAAEPGLEPPAAQRTLLSRIAAVAIAAVATALFWYPFARAAEVLFWELPGHVSSGLAWAAAIAGVAAAAVGALLALASRRLRPWVVLVLLGAMLGIAVPFLPIVLDVGIPREEFYRLMWFPRWI